MNDNQNGNGPRFNVHYGRRSNNPWEDLLRNLKKQFGGGGGGSGGGARGSIGPNQRLPFYIFGAIVLAVVTLTSFYTIDVSEEGVVTRFGRYHSTTAPGLHFKLPFPIDQVHKIPSKILLQEEFGFRSDRTKNSQTSYVKKGFVGESLMLTGDLNVADVEWIVQYRIADPWKYLFHGRDVPKTLRDVSMSVMRRVVGDRLVGEVLTVGRVEIADEARELTQAILDRYDLGIRIENIMLQDVNPPESVKPAFNEVNAAKQEQEQAINQAEREYNRVIPEAKGKAQRQIADAEASSVEAVNRAKGDASKFRQVLVEYRKAPEVTRRRIYLETLEEVLSRVGQFTVMDSQLKGIVPVYGKSIDPTTAAAATNNAAEKKQ